MQSDFGIGDAIENLKMAIENAERAEAKSQKGILALFRCKDKTITKLNVTLQKYEALQKKLFTLSKQSDQAFAKDIQALSESFTNHTEKRNNVSKKTEKAFSWLFFTQAGKELRAAKNEAAEAAKRLNEAFKTPDRLIQEQRKELETRFKTLQLSKTDPALLRAEKALNELNKALANNATYSDLLSTLAEARKKVGWAENAFCQILVDRYKALCQQAKTDNKNLYYFAPQYWNAEKNQKLAQFIKKVNALVDNPSAPSLWNECSEVIRELKLPGDASACLIPFLRFLVLQAENPYLLSDSTLKQLEAAAETASGNGQDESYGFLQSLVMVVQQLKEEMVTDVGRANATAGTIVARSKNTMDAFRQLFDAKIELPGHIAHFESNWRAMFDDARLNTLVEEFKKINTCESDKLMAFFKNADFKTKMINFFRDANPVANKDLITRNVEMEAGDFIKLWKLILLKANDPALVGKKVEEALEKLQKTAEASKQDDEQRIGALIGPLQGVLQAIREELQKA